MIKLTNKTPEFNEIDLVFDVRPLPKVEEIANKLHDKFHRFTIGDSYERNEFRVINDKYGFHYSMSGVILCEYEFYEHVVESATAFTSEVTEKRVKIINSDNVTLERFTELLVESEIVSQGYLDKVINDIQSDKQTKYVELQIKGDSVHFSIDNGIGGGYYYLKLNSPRYSKFGSEVLINELGINGHELSGRASIKDLYEYKINDEISKYIDAGVAKIDNGFIYNNNYYSSVDEVIDVIKEENRL